MMSLNADRKAMSLGRHYMISSLRYVLITQIASRSTMESPIGMPPCQANPRLNILSLQVIILMAKLPL